MLPQAAGSFHLVLIKPTHYDDDGYPIQWFRSAIPSNTLACLNGLAVDARQREVLGPDASVHLHTYDETNRRVDTARIIRDLGRSGGKALIALVGVQTNQFPRAVDLARPFVEAGLPVAIGGFHVSGCIAMLPELPPDIRAAQAMGIALRLKSRRDRRHGMPIESPLAFYPRHWTQTARKAWGYFRVWRQARTTLKDVLAAPDRWTYRDLAITPPEDDEFETLSLYSATAGGGSALAKMRREDESRSRVAALTAESAP